MAKTEPKEPLLPAALGIFFAALIVRLFYAMELRNSPLFQVPTLDAAIYYDLATQYAHGHWLDPVGQPYWQPAFYSQVMAVWMKVAESSVWPVKLAQLALGSVNCALVYTLGTRVFGRRIGLIAGLAAALYGPMIYFDGELLTPTLQIFLNLSSILLLLKALDKKSTPLFCAAGALVGLSILTRPDAAFFLIAAVGWVTISLRDNLPVRRILAISGLMLACAVMPIVPTTIRNLVLGKDLVLISSNGGLNFYIGNNPHEEETREIRPGPDWDAIQELPLKENPRAKPSEQSAYFYRKSLQYATGHPLDYVGLIFKKSVMYITGIEGRRNNDLYYYRDYSLLYSALLFKVGRFAFPFGIVFPLALFGMLRSKRDRKVLLLYLYLGAQFLAVIAFFVTARYRVPAAPVFLIFASLGAVELWEIARRKQWKRACVPLALAACALALSNANVYGVDTNRARIDADTHFEIAEVLAKLGDVQGVSDHLRQSIKLNPDYEFSRYRYAVLLMSLGDPAEARNQLLECLRLDPQSPAANAKLGEIEMRRGNLRGALRYYKAAVKSNEVFASDLATLAEKAYSQGDYAMAREALCAVVQKKPGWAEARRSLGVTLMKLGRYEDSIKQLQEACRLAPDSADSFIALGLACYRSGRRSDAESAFEKAVRIGPKDDVRRKIEGYLRKEHR